MGQFLYPEQREIFYYRRKSFGLKGEVRPELKNDGEIKLKYGLKYIYGVTGPVNDRIVESLPIEVGENIELHALYKTPLIRLVSDLNQDGVLDVMVYSFTMTDSCGVCWTTELFLSKLVGDKIFQKPITHKSCNCVT